MCKIKKLLFLLVIFSFFSIDIFAQQGIDLPNGYRNIKLGLTVDEVKNLLEKDSVFGYRGERDVSLLPTLERVLIETNGSSMLGRCWFQFYEDKLYTISININEDKMDYYSVFTKLTEKYGQPQTLNPSKSEWISETIQLSLEKPLCLKYLDLEVYNKLQEIVDDNVNAETYLREKFLDSL